MLVYFLRVIFVIIATLVGLQYGERIYRAMGWEGSPALLGASVGFGIAITLLACEIAFRRKFTRTLFTLLIGLAGGLLLSYFALIVLDLAIQNRDIKENLDIPMTLLIVYLVVITVLHNADRFRVVIPFVEFRSRRVDETRSILDLSALADARLPAIVSTGLLGYRLATHGSVIRECQRLAAGREMRDQVRGRRALEMIAQLRGSPEVHFEVEVAEIPRAKTPEDHAVEMTRLEEGRLVTTDADLATLAKSEDVRCVDLSEIGNLLSPHIRIGDTIHTFLQKEGEEPEQAVGFLQDGSMVVVENGREHLGSDASCTVLRMHHTTNGRIIFARMES